MKGCGCILVIIAVGIIFLHTVIFASYNETQVREHPIKTVLDNGRDLIPAYTFKPPLEPFEILVYGVGIVGAVIFIVGCFKKGDEDKKE